MDTNIPVTKCFIPPDKYVGAGHIAVPDYLFKVVLAIQGDRMTMFAALVPNIDRPEGALESFMTMVAEIERVTGLDFFAAIQHAEQGELEATVRLFADLMPYYGPRDQLCPTTSRQRGRPASVVKNAQTARMITLKMAIRAVSAYHADGAKGDGKRSAMLFK